MKKYALVGENIKKSFAPLVHKVFFDMYGVEAEYELVETNDLKGSLDYLRTLDGFNVAAPYKAEIIPYLENCSLDVRISNAANCVSCREGKMYGYNSEIWGFVDSLHYLEIDPSRKQVLVLGLGGMARAVICAFKKFQSNIYLYNRSFERAKELSNEFNVAALNNLDGIRAQFDIIINCTSLGNIYKLDQCVLKEEDMVGAKYIIDANYVEENKFLKQAKSLGIPAVNGLAMLFFQVLHTEHVWQSKEPTELEINYMYRKVEELIYENIGR
mgnify:FL=1